MRLLPRPRARGFTLIEQIGVVALVGAASASALPRLAELQSQADAVALASLAGTAGRAMWTNQAACLVTGQQAVPGKCLAISGCAQVADLLVGGLPAGFMVEPAPLARGEPGAGTACSLVHPASGGRASFQGLPTGP